MNDVSPIGPDDGKPRLIEGDRFRFNEDARGWCHACRVRDNIEYIVILMPACNLADAREWLRTFKECRRISPILQRYTGMIYLLGRTDEFCGARYNEDTNVVEFYSDASTGRLNAVLYGFHSDPLQDTIHHESVHFLTQVMYREIEMLAKQLDMVPRSAVESAAAMVSPRYLPWCIQEKWRPFSGTDSSLKLAGEFVAETYMSQVIYRRPWTKGLIPALDALRERVLTMEVEPVHASDAARRLRRFHRQEDDRWRVDGRIFRRT
ncbi:MAG: hypothetical protein PHV34_08815 [Verrucomicrobiae bacterium]|nr:hypothetical protein [Verrucomicrobiae bacterium]